MPLTTEQRQKVTQRIQELGGTQPSTGGDFDMASAVPVQEEFDLASAQEVPDANDRGYFTPSLQGIPETEKLISERESLIPSFARSAAQTLSDPKSVIAPNIPQQFKNAMLLLHGAGASFEAAESIPANTLLAAQRGDFSQLPQQLKQGVTGQRPAQMGDVIRATGAPMAQDVAPALGMAYTGGLRPVKGASAASKAVNIPMNILRATTAAPVKVAEKIVGTPAVIGKFLARPGVKAVKGVVDFPYQKTLEIKKVAIKYYRDTNRWYGDELFRLADKVEGVVPNDFIASSFQKGLQRAGVLDDVGNVIDRQIIRESPIVKELIRTYEEIATSPKPTTAFRTVIDKLKGLRKLIRSSAQKKNVPINQDERVLSYILKDIGDLIGDESDNIRTLNKNYAIKRDIFDKSNEVFKVFKGEYDTKRGESMLSNYFSLDEGSKKLLSDVEGVFGLRFVENAKRYSATKQLEKFPWVRGIMQSTHGAGFLAKEGAKSLTKNLTPGQVRAVLIREVMKEELKKRDR